MRGDRPKGADIVKCLFTPHARDRCYAGSCLPTLVHPARGSTLPAQSGGQVFLHARGSTFLASPSLMNHPARRIELVSADDVTTIPHATIHPPAQRLILIYPHTIDSNAFSSASPLYLYCDRLATGLWAFTVDPHAWIDRATSGTVARSGLPHARDRPRGLSFNRETRFTRMRGIDPVVQKMFLRFISACGSTLMARFQRPHSLSRDRPHSILFSGNDGCMRGGSTEDGSSPRRRVYPHDVL